MTFEEWMKTEDAPLYLSEMEKALGKAAWDAGFLEGLGFQNDRIQELNQTIVNLRNLRMKHPERTKCACGKPVGKLSKNRHFRGPITWCLDCGPPEDLRKSHDL